MYVYDCNSILTTGMNNRSDQEMIRLLTSLIEDLKIQGMNSSFHLMYNKASTALNMTMKTMNIKYQLVPQATTEQIIQRERFKHSRNTS